MKAVAQAGFLDPMIDPEKNLERLGARISGQSVEPSTFEDPVNGRPSCESLGITQSIDDMLAIEQPGSRAVSLANDGSDDELDLEGIDDDEISRLLLRPDEVKRKQEMWEKRKENIEWLKKQEEKAADDRKNPDKAARRQRQQRKRKINRANQEGHHTAGEAIKTIQKQKRISQRINYDVLDSLKQALSSPKVEKIEEPVALPSAPPREESESDEEEEYETKVEPKSNFLSDTGLGDMLGGGGSDEEDYD